MTYLRNSWYVAAWSHDLPTGSTMSAMVLGDPLVLWRTEGGDLAALEDRCVHRFAPLSMGRCEGERLRCMYHGLAFDTSGTVTDIPGQDLIPARAQVRRYPIVERHGWLWIWMGKESLADPNLIPPVLGIDDPRFLQGHGVLDYHAEAHLISENLLDFSHLAYVHPTSFGAGQSWAQNKPRVTPVARGVRVERWIEGELTTTGRGDKIPMDKWMEYEFLLPGVLVMMMAFYPEGTAALLDGSPPELEAADRLLVTSQAVTPVSDGRARYFFNTGPRSGPAGEAVRDMLMKMTLQAFDEDKAMIEAQQRVIDATGFRPVMPISADKGITIFNNLVTKLAKKELDEGVSQVRTLAG